MQVNGAAAEVLRGRSSSRNTMLRGSRVVRDRHDSHKEKKMGKYFLAWLLGVPAGILVLVFVVMHVF